MATLPTVPTFVANDTSVTKLAQLSQAASFLIDLGTRPAWHFYRTTTAAISASTWTSPGYTKVAFDSDGVQSSGSAVIVTQGIYACEGCADFIVSSLPIFADLRFLVTFGANNPHHVNGTTLIFGQRGGQTASGTNVDGAFTVGSICPAVLYPGDKVDLQVFVSANATLNDNSNQAFMGGRFVANFTGYFLRTGS